MKLRKNLIPPESEAEHRTGFLRVLDLLNRDSGKLMLCGILACIGLIPYVLGILFAVRRGDAWMVIPWGLLGGAIAGPQLTALTDRILRSLRDDFVDWWSNYRRVWKRDFFVSLIPGALTGVSLGSQIYAACQIASGVQASAIAMILIFLEVNGILLWMWAQIPLIPESFGTVLKNAAILSILHFGRTVGASALCLLYSGIVWLCWPLSEIPFFFTQLWLPLLLAFFLIYKPCNEIFRIEQRLTEQLKNS